MWKELSGHLQTCPASIPLHRASSPLWLEQTRLSMARLAHISLGSSGSSSRQTQDHPTTHRASIISHCQTKCSAVRIMVLKRTVPRQITAITRTSSNSSSTPLLGEALLTTRTISIKTTLRNLSVPTAPITPTPTTQHPAPIPRSTPTTTP